MTSKMTKAQIKESKELALEFFNTQFTRGVNRIYGLMTGSNTFRLFIAQDRNELIEITKVAGRLAAITYVSEDKGLRLNGYGYNKIDHFVDILNRELAKDHEDKKQQSECAKFKYERL